MKDIKNNKHKHKHTHANKFYNHLIDTDPGTTIKYEGDVHNDNKAVDSSMLSPGDLGVAKNHVYVRNLLIIREISLTKLIIYQLKTLRKSKTQLIGLVV